MNNVEDIIHGFGKIQEDVSKRMLTHYPAMVFPQSLLPQPKQEIRVVLEQAIKIKESQGELEAINLLKQALFFLDSFIEDEEAYKVNDKILGQDKYWETLRNRSKL